MLVQRAAALKRREQEALKLSASTQLGPVEGESEIRSSELHLTPAGSLEKDSEKAGVPEADVSQATHEESLICIEPTGKLDKVDSKNQEEPETNLHGSVGGASEYYTNSSDYGGKKDNSNQAAADQMARRNSDISNSSTIKEISSEDQKSVDLDKSDMLQTAAGSLVIKALLNSFIVLPNITGNPNIIYLFSQKRMKSWLMISQMPI